MIKLLDILYELAEKYHKGEVWVTAKRLYGAKSATGDIRYFMDREHAVLFAKGMIKPPYVGRPEPKEHTQHHEPVQHYTK
jgi:hypothetical protein